MNRLTYLGAVNFNQPVFVTSIEFLEFTILENFSICILCEDAIEYSRLFKLIYNLASINTNIFVFIGKYYNSYHDVALDVGAKLGEMELDTPFITFIQDLDFEEALIMLWRYELVKSSKGLFRVNSTCASIFVLPNVNNEDHIQMIRNAMEKMEVEEE